MVILYTEPRGFHHLIELKPENSVIEENDDAKKIQADLKAMNGPLWKASMVNKEKCFYATDEKDVMTYSNGLKSTHTATDEEKTFYKALFAPVMPAETTIEPKPAVQTPDTDKLSVEDIKKTLADNGIHAPAAVPATQAIYKTEKIAEYTTVATGLPFDIAIEKITTGDAPSQQATEEPEQSASNAEPDGQETPQQCESEPEAKEHTEATKPVEQPVSTDDKATAKPVGEKATAKASNIPKERKPRNIPPLKKSVPDTAYSIEDMLKKFEPDIQKLGGNDNTDVIWVRDQMAQMSEEDMSIVQYAMSAEKSLLKAIAYIASLCQKSSDYIVEGVIAMPCGHGNGYQFPREKALPYILEYFMVDEAEEKRMADEAAAKKKAENEAKAKAAKDKAKKNSGKKAAAATPALAPVIQLVQKPEETTTDVTPTEKSAEVAKPEFTAPVKKAKQVDPDQLDMFAMFS